MAEKDVSYLLVRLTKVHKNANFDILCITDPVSQVIYRVHQPEFSGDSLGEDHLVRAVLKSEEVISGMILISLENIEKENLLLAEQLKIPIRSTPKVKPSKENELTASMMLCSAAPVYPV